VTSSWFLIPHLFDKIFMYSVCGRSGYDTVVTPCCFVGDR